MDITCINPITTKATASSYYKPENNSLTFSANIPTDTFTKSTLALLNNLKLTVAEYNQLSKADIEAINKFIDNFIENKSYLKYEESFLTDNNHWFTNYHETWQNFNKYLRYHEIAAKRMQEKLDSDFGAKNYVVISIGRSLSSICKCLGYKIGEENVIQLPMSEAWRFAPYKIPKLKQNAIDTLTDYLASNGMSKEAVETSDKKYIFTDFKATGNSMRGAETLFKSDRMFGNSSNIHFMNIYEILTTFDSMKREIIDKIACLHFQDLSVVSRCENLFSTAKAVEKPEDYDILLKSFYFKFIDNEMNKINQNLNNMTL